MNLAARDTGVCRDQGLQGSGPGMLIQTRPWTRLGMAVTGVACYLARAAGSAKPELPSLVLPD
eukprot:4434-Eustigmatos_ZCMA.PRE.1